ncbi:PACE efflux transporter [Testudinibacter sp. TR-2022]|uniref:PACE efflux transporter n=1 Tax=Testudinibacter sp. TR-2022 TaxID=2585029 RepID=UPI0011182C42|nr:PACE efflux transporter [Testudinibacter sp. TR-2022]TNH05681.1 PACE efflux transporter [Pasteurellaceae bacterium Phil31]TNH06776.1 PACE efflux transporter [Pasteurellaceae bacterium Phil11]TNH08359.1 PACE efflux transporter [Testudinibacter sp. TR-2022]TNH10514.1 PACE efflux transporter [Testudinibacter sp. TR-2022]TNH22507.1 PACE efflux transporter [Testudinibacter sp. TR-2022]
MSFVERIFHAALFEVLAVIFSVIGLTLLTDHSVSALSGTVIVISLMAMVWNFVFNWGFDRVFRGERVLRGFKVRCLHALLFEGGLLLFTIPVVAYLLNISFYQAFIMDLGITVFILLYTVLYNWVYDHVRVWIIRRRA